MKLISLDIRNFRVIREASLDFPDLVIGIIGPNGAGKSAIIEAIAWALYGNQAARTGREGIKSRFAGANDNCEVSLTFSVNGERFRVVRRLVGRTDRAEVELYRGEQSESVGVNETRSHIGQLLGLDWRGFLTSFLARQQELNALSDLQPARRKDHLAGMLGIERLDKGLQRSKEDSRLYREKIGFFENQIAGTDQLDLEIAALSKKEKELQDKWSETKGACSEAEKVQKNAAEELLQCQEKRNDWLKQTAAISGLKTTRENLADLLNQLKKELTNLNASEAEKRALEAELADGRKLQIEFDQLEKARNRRELAVQIKAEAQQVGGDLQRLIAQQESSSRKLEEIVSALNRIPADLDGQIRTITDSLETARTEYSDTNAASKTHKNDISRLERQLSSMAELGPESICDRCLRPMGSDLSQIKAHLLTEIRGLKERSSSVSIRLEEVKSKGEKLKAEQDRLQSQKERRSNLVTNKDSLAAEISSRRQSVESLSEREEKLKEKLVALGQVEFDSHKWQKLKAEVDELEKLRQRKLIIEGQLVRLPDLNRQIDEKSGKVSGLDNDLARVRQELDDLNFSEIAYGKVEQKMAESQQKLEEARGSHLEISKELEITGRELEMKREQDEKLSKVKSELEESRQSLFYLEKLSSLFGEFRGQVISSIRPTLADLSSRLVSDMTDGRYTMLELDEKYNLRLLDYGQFYEIERFSGGEKDLANLCLRLAISQSLTEASGLSSSFIILDEVFGSQDEERRELIIKALRNIRHRFPQVILITHIDEVKEQVERLIEVSPTGNGWSEVKVTI